MSTGQTSDPIAAYEKRIAALEAKLNTLEESVISRTVRESETFDWKTWAERFGLLIAWGVMILILGAFKPDQMFAWNSYASMFGSNAMVVVLTLALMIPLTTGDFDLSVASVMGLSSMLLAVLNVKMGMPIGGAIVFVLAAGAIVGLINSFFILYFGVHSLIVTLGTGYFINGVILWVSNSNTIAGVSMDLVKAVILTRLFGIPIGFYYALVLSVLVWYVFQHTSLGRVSSRRLRAFSIPVCAGRLTRHRRWPSCCRPSLLRSSGQPPSIQAGSMRPALSSLFSSCRPASWG